MRGKGNRDKSFSAKRAIKARKIISQANFSYFIAHCCKHQTARPSLEKHWQNWENVTKVKMGKHYHPYPRCNLANVEKNACRWNKNVLRIFLLWNPALVVSRKLFETKFCSGGNSKIDRWWSWRCTKSLDSSCLVLIIHKYTLSCHVDVLRLKRVVGDDK